MLSRIVIPIPPLASLAVLVPAAGAKADQVDMSRLVVVGDSLSAGYQNSCLLATQQVNGCASLVAERAATDLPLPLIGAPGAPPRLTLVDPAPPPVAERISDGFGLRLDPTAQTRNLAVPGARVGDALDPVRETFHDDIPDSRIRISAG